MAYETILYEVRESIGTLTLNRPDKYNALTLKMYREILDALKQIERDKNVRAVLITGAGNAFCSGADLTDPESQLDADNVSDVLREGLNRIVLSIRKLEKPVLAAINGVAAGAGGGLALACDFRTASEEASFVFAAFTRIGLIPDAGSTYFLPQLVGVSKALELSLFADSNHRLSAEEALQLGIVNHVFPHDAFMKETNTIASQLAKMATRAVGLTKRAMYQAIEHSLGTALEYEAQLQSITFRTQDFQEGVQAFIEKREPIFTGE